MPLPPRPEFEPQTDAEIQPNRPGGVLPWLRLMRLPNVFTAIADVAMGYLFVHRGIESASQLAVLAFASAALYTAGMVLNDLFDWEVDARERPFRPLPSRQISAASARALGFGLLFLGIALGWCAGFLDGAPLVRPWRSGVVATLLALGVVGYDGLIKNTPLGPLGMGACRLLNVLLGMSAGPDSADSLVLGYGLAELLIAAGIGIYIVGVTWFARSEAVLSRSRVLAAAMIVMTGGIVVLALAAKFTDLRVGRQIYWLLLLLLMFTVLRRCGAAVFDPRPQRVQAAVKHSILSLIWLDAAIVLVVAPAAYGVAIAALLIPAYLLGRWVYST